MYNEPHLRSRIDLRQNPVHWIPATDFDDVFRFIDRTSQGERDGRGGGERGRGAPPGGVGEVWDLVIEQGNLPWDYDSEKPLFK